MTSDEDGGQQRDPASDVPPRATVHRRVPRWSELRPLLRFEKLELAPGKRRLQQAATIADLRRAARHRVPRRRDVHNGFAVPPKLSPRTIADIARRPRWWMNLLTTEPLTFATIPAGEPEAHAAFIDGVFDPGVSFDDLTIVRDSWQGPLVVKGITTVEDARKALDHGADAVVLSNHGGRQLDRAPVALEALPRVADTLGDEMELFIDSGVRTGADIAAALALGATACIVGRPYLYGLMAGGEDGVAKSIDIFATELRRTMHLLGAPDISAIDRSMARLRER